MNHGHYVYVENSIRVAPIEPLVLDPSIRKNLNFMENFKVLRPKELPETVTQTSTSLQFETYDGNEAC